MLLHALSTKIGRHLRIIVPWTDIRVSQATNALHGLERSAPCVPNQSSDWHPFGLLKTSAADNRSCLLTLK